MSLVEDSVEKNENKWLHMIKIASEVCVTQSALNNKENVLRSGHSHK